MKIAYLNGKYLPLEKASISILDRGFLYGDGLFETIRAYKGIPFLLEKHMARLFKSLKNLGIRFTINGPEIKKIVYNLLDKNGLSSPSKKDAYIKIIVTRGKASGLLIPKTKTDPTLAIYVLPYAAQAKNYYKRGVNLCVFKTGFNENSKISGNKTLNYLDNIMQRCEAAKKGFDDGISINTEGFVSETSSSNVFLVKKRKLYTPNLKSGCLAGVTRDEIIRLAHKIKLRIEERFIKPDSLFSAEEIFLTNSLTGITPAVKVERKIIRDGRPGRITRRLTGLFDIAVENYSKNIRKKRI